MKKEIRVVDKKKMLVQITTLDERWYGEPTEDKITGVPIFDWRPSSTWKAEYYPKGIGFFKWLADKGWDEAEALKQAAGDKGSKVHYACSDIDKGIGVAIDAEYLNRTTEKEEGLTTEEITCIDSYIRFLDLTTPELLTDEIAVMGARGDNTWGGTIDKILRFPKDFKIGRVTFSKGIYIVDLKTSQNIWESHKIQLNFYDNSDIDYKALGISDGEWKSRKLAILQLGYFRNGDGYKFTEIPRDFSMCEIAHRIWANENPNAKPKQRDFPLVLEAKCRKLKGVENGNKN